MGGIYGNFGIRRLIDQNLRFFRAGLPVSLRIKNFQDNSAFADMGLTFTPSASGALVATGTTDILISPPPSVSIIGLQTLGMAQMAQSQLRVGARRCIISHSWVEAQMVAPWFQQQLDVNPGLVRTDPELIWRLPCVVGLVTDNLLLEIVDVSHEDAYGGIMNWFLSCNTSELSAS